MENEVLVGILFCLIIATLFGILLVSKTEDSEEEEYKPIPNECEGRHNWVRREYGLVCVSCGKLGSN